MSLKNQLTEPGMDHGIVRLVAKRLNHYATPGPALLCTKKYFREMQDMLRSLRSALLGLYEIKYSQTSVHELNPFLKVIRKPKLFPP